MQLFQLEEVAGYWLLVNGNKQQATSSKQLRWIYSIL